MPSKKDFFETSDGTVLYFEDHGAGDPILLVPGFSCSTRFFQRNIPTLAERFRVVTFDPRGHGRSSKFLYGNDMRHHAQDIKELIDHLDLHGVTLAGWSLGGSTSVLYCELFQNYHLKALALLDAPLYPFGDKTWNRHGCGDYNIDAWQARMSQWVYEPEVYLPNFVQGMFHGPCSQEDLNWMMEEVKKLPTALGTSLHYDFMRTDSVSKLRSVTVPVAVFGAESNMYPNGAEMSRYYLDFIQTEKQFFEFTEGGHLLFYNESEKFNRCLAEFIRRL